VGDVKKFEQELLRFAQSKHPALLTDIATKKQLDDDLKERIKAAIEEFKKTFTA
jgi:F-type H+-transporting ATPase subunit alpha